MTAVISRLYARFTAWRVRRWQKRRLEFIGDAVFHFRPRHWWQRWL